MLGDARGQRLTHSFDPQSAATHYNLAVELSRQRPIEAIQHLHKTIGLNGKLVAARRLLEELRREELLTTLYAQRR